MTATTSDFRVTERNNETDALIRVVAVMSGVTIQQAAAVEEESIAADGNHIRLERWNVSHDGETCGWEYL